ncbi:MAG TPA: DUF2231 domain-containing protein [Gemmatimonadaceae bacterium]|nr:DUF2231 domain-containing protein [Gemmatimonadaceae bacterium]
MARAGTSGLRADEAGGWRALLPAAPLHPIFVHFSVALTAASLLFDVAARLFDEPTLAHAGWWTLAFSAAATVATIITGLVSRFNVELGEGRARTFLRLHMVLGPVFFGLLLGLLVWRYALWSARVTPDWLYLAALAIAGVVMLVQGYLGGELVYRWGAEVRGGHAGLRQEHAQEPRPALHG